MPTHGIEKIASDPTKRASCKWKCLQLVPKAETLLFILGQVKEDVIFYPHFIIRRRWQCSCHESGKPHLQPRATWIFQEKSLRHSAKQCLDYTGSQHSRAVVMFDKPHHIGWSRSVGWSLYLFLKIKKHQWYLKVCTKCWLPQASLFFPLSKAIPVILNPPVEDCLT